MSGTSGPRLSTIPFKDLNSFSFDGVDDYIDTNSTYSELNSTTKASWSVWVKPTLGTTMVLSRVSSSTSTSAFVYQFPLLSSGEVFMQIGDTTRIVRTGSTLLTDGVWSHILVCYDGTLANGSKTKIFINGVDSTSSDSTTATSLVNANYPLSIGRRDQTPTYYYDGNMDEFAIWSGTDLRNDASTIYNGGIPTNLNDNGLTAPTTYFRMGDNAIWNGQTWIMVDVNGGYTNRSVNMIEANRTTDVPPNPWTNTLSTYFDGIDDYVDCGDNDNLSFGDSVTDSPFSISAWIKVTTGTSFPIVGKYLAYPNGEYKFMKQADGTLLIRIISGNNELQRRGRTTNSIDSLVGQWVHVVTTYNGNSDYSGLKIYVNSVRSDVANNGKNVYTAMSNTSYPLEIGKLANTNIDEVSIFNTELSTSDITTIYNSGIPTDISAMSGLISWWRMGDNDTYPTINDVIGSNDGTMTNMSSANFVTDVPTFSKKSIALDGVDDYVGTAQISLLSVNTISFWVKNSTSLSGTLFGDVWATSSYSLYWIPSTNNIYFRLGNSNAGYWELQVASGLLSDGQWHHHCLSRNALVLNYYIDGVLQTNVTNNTLNSASGTETTIRNIGANAGSSLPITASLDEISLFNTQLSQSDVTTIYNSGVPNDISSLSPLSWWRCGDGDTSPILTDNGSGGNNGTMTNFTTFSTDVPT